MKLGRALIDGNSIGFAAHQSGARLTTNGTDTTAIFQSLRTVRTVITQHRAFDPIVLWDGKSWRKDSFTDYKANRDDDPKVAEMRRAYKQQRPHIANGLVLLGVPQGFAKNMEADDLAGILTPKLRAKSEQVMLISGDKDWLQLVGPGVVWFDPIRDRTCNARNFAEFTGFANPAAFVQGKALMGDAGDNIPGVGGIGEKGAKELLTTWGSVENFLESSCPPELPKKLRDLADASTGKQAIFARNISLMELKNPAGRPAPEGLTISRKPLDKNGFREFCEEWNFFSILRDFDGWIEPFRKSEE